MSEAQKIRVKILEDVLGMKEVWNALIPRSSEQGWTCVKVGDVVVKRLKKAGLEWTGPKQRVAGLEVGEEAVEVENRK